jgi:hypothetical protein
MSDHAYFEIDPFSIIFDIVRGAYGETPAICQWSEDLLVEGDGPVGQTELPETPRLTPVVTISANLPVKDAVEILAHELAHVVVWQHYDDKGNTHEDGSQWSIVFDIIHRQFLWMMEDLQQPRDEAMAEASRKDYAEGRFQTPGEIIEELKKTPPPPGPPRMTLQ